VDAARAPDEVPERDIEALVRGTAVPVHGTAAQVRGWDRTALDATDVERTTVAEHWSRDNHRQDSTALAYT
jgi:hypothetical protein